MTELKYAICNEVYGDIPFEQSFLHARRVGYQGLELAPFTLDSNPTAITQSRRNDIRQLAVDNQLEIIGLHWLLAQTSGCHLTSSDADTRKRTSEYLADLSSLCRDLGGNVMVFGSPQQRRVEGMSQNEAIAHAVDVFHNLTPSLEENKVVLALEPLGPAEDNFLNTAESAIELIKEIDSPWIQLQLDVKAMATEQKPVPDIIRDSAEWLVHFHANDPNRMGPGMGDFDFVPVFEALRECKYDGWISVEVFDYSPGYDTLTTESINYLNSL